MCTAISDNFSRHLFGRTLDLEFSYGEEVVILPRRYPLKFLHGGVLNSHFAIIGTATLQWGEPLYYDGANESGLAGAALNFPKYASYRAREDGRLNLSSAELLPRVLAECGSVEEARALLKSVNITAESVSEELPATPLHWIFADETEAITVEQTERGIEIADNPYGVLTNSPDFSYHAANLANYLSLSPMTQKCSICKEKVTIYSRGLGGFGLPGDFSSASRFVRAAFLRSHTVGEEPVSRYFHIMDSLAVPFGAVITDEGRAVSTIYTSCFDAAARIYYFTTYENRRIRGIRLTEELASSDKLTVYPMTSREDILFI